jgi:hypothetical protein
MNKAGSDAGFFVSASTRIQLRAIEQAGSDRIQDDGAVGARGLERNSIRP